jgi:hypothetical protein
MVEFPQSVPNLTESSTNLFELVKGRRIVLYPDADIRLAFNRAIAIETTRGWRIAKEKASHKIDVIVALAMSAHGSVHQVGKSFPAHAFSAESSQNFARAIVQAFPNGPGSMPRGPRAVSWG